MKKNTYQETLRLHIGQRIVITTAFNSWGLPVGAIGTIVKHHLGDTHLDSDYFWKGWQEQFVLFDGTPKGLRVNPAQIRRGHMAPITEYDFGDARNPPSGGGSKIGDCPLQITIAYDGETSHLPIHRLFLTLGEVMAHLAEQDDAELYNMQFNANASVRFEWGVRLLEDDWRPYPVRTSAHSKGILTVSSSWYDDLSPEIVVGLPLSLGVGLGRECLRSEAHSETSRSDTMNGVQP